MSSMSADPSAREHARRASAPFARKPAELDLHERRAWYVCRTRARAEKQVERLMAKEGLEVFVPMLNSEQRWTDRVKRIAFPLFPGYAFVRTDMADFARVLRTPGVVAILKLGGHPTRVRDEEIQSIRCLLSGANETGITPERIEVFVTGEEVVVVSGPFSGMSGILIEDKGRTRVVVRISALQQATSVELSRDLVVALGG